MTTLYIENLLCHQNLQVDFDEGVNLVTGRHSTGKTSLSVILGALLSGDSNPLNLSATQKKSYITDGCTEGVAKLEDVSWNPTRGISSPHGQEPQEKPHVVNLVDFTSAMSLKARGEVWEGLFLPDNPREILEKAWTLPARQLDVVVEMIEKNGGEWSVAQKIYEDQRKESKRRWSRITGKPYGAKVAASWVPEGWSLELDGQSEEELQERITEARDMLTAATAKIVIKASAIAEAKRKRDKELPELEKQIEQAKKQEQEFRDNVEKKTKDYSKLESKVKKLKEIVREGDWLLEKKPQYVCPSCEVGLEVTRSGELRQWEQPGEAELKEAKVRSKKAKGTLNSDERVLCMERDLLKEIQGKMRAAGQRVYALERDFNRVSRESKLADSEATDDEMTGSEKANAESALDDAKRKYEAYKQFHAAQKEFNNIRHLEYIVNLLGPSGIRNQIMQQVVDRVKKILKRAKEITGWMETSISRDYSLSSGGRPLALTATNENLKAQYLMQIAVGMLKNAQWIVLDNVDVIKDESWGGLVKLVNALASKRPGIRIVLCGTSVENPDESWNVINLDTTDAGVT